MEPESSLGNEQSRQTVGVLGKALVVIEAIVWRRPQTIGELAATTGVEKAAVYRILNTFVERGFAVKDGDTRRYSPGPRLLAAANRLDRIQDVARLARPHMRELLEEYGETVNLAVLAGTDVQYLEILESGYGLRMAATVGDRHPVYSTALGKAILSTMDPAEANAVVGNRELQKQTFRTIADPTTFEADLAQIRQRGYAMDIEENELGAVCVAAAIRVSLGPATHAISISCPSARVGRAELQQMGQRLIDVCRLIGGQSRGL